MNIKLTGLAFAAACSASWVTFYFMFLKSGWKKDIISYGGRSIELAPR
jgi:hypothetical protein